jgi:choline dehydrogenase-like flavoprotein
VLRDAREVPAGAVLETDVCIVGADGRVHGTANPYVAGPSVFPTGGQANPMLTIVALALRLAAHLRAHLG